MCSGFCTESFTERVSKESQGLYHWLCTYTVIQSYLLIVYHVTDLVVKETFSLVFIFKKNYIQLHFTKSILYVPFTFSLTTHIAFLYQE